MFRFLFLALVLGSWNMKYFPSGRSEHRASPRVESANTFDAADQIRANLSGCTNVVLALQEVRDAHACSNLIAAIGREDLRLAVVTDSREYDRRRCWQQTALLSDLPVLASGAREFTAISGRSRPPRGFCYALFADGTNGAILCFSVHLKSNYGARTEEQLALNRVKRAAAMDQILAFADSFCATSQPVRISRIAVLGDFNADFFRTPESVFDHLIAAGFRPCFTRDSERGTHPGVGRWPDSTLDYVFFRGLEQVGPVRLAPSIPLTDHRLIVGDWR